MSEEEEIKLAINQGIVDRPPPYFKGKVYKVDAHLAVALEIAPDREEDMDAWSDILTEHVAARLGVSVNEATALMDLWAWNVYEIEEIDVE